MRDRCHQVRCTRGLKEMEKASDFLWKPEPVAWQPFRVSTESNTSDDSLGKPTPTQHSPYTGTDGMEMHDVDVSGERVSVKGLDPVRAVPDPVY